MRGRERFFDLNLNYADDNYYVKSIGNIILDSKYAYCEETLIEVTLIISLLDYDNENNC